MVRLRHGPFFLFLSLSSPFPLRFPFPSFTLPVPSFSFSFPFSFLFLSFFVFLLFLSFFFSFRFPFPFLFLSLLLCFPFPSFILPFPFPFPRSCESFGEGVKPALGKNDKRKKIDTVWKNHLKGLGVFTRPRHDSVLWPSFQGNGAGKWLWLLSLEELSRNCPFVANLTVQRPGACDLSLLIWSQISFCTCGWSLFNLEHPPLESKDWECSLHLWYSLKDPTFGVSQGVSTCYDFLALSISWVALSRGLVNAINVQVFKLHQLIPDVGSQRFPNGPGWCQFHWADSKVPSPGNSWPLRPFRWDASADAEDAAVKRCATRSCLFHLHRWLVTGCFSWRGFKWQVQVRQVLEKL